MQIDIRGVVVEIVHNEEFDAITIQSGKKKSKLKIEPGKLNKSMLYSPAQLRIELDPGLFNINPETGEIVNSEALKACQEFADSIPPGETVTLSTAGLEPVVLKGKDKRQPA